MQLSAIERSGKSVLARSRHAIGVRSVELIETLKTQLPIETQALEVGARQIGLVIVDEVNGFCTVGAGHLAPAAPDSQITQMVTETDRLAKLFTHQRRPILAFLDTHEAGKPEPPYPPHCEIGTGEEQLVPELAWLEQDKHTTLIRKDCINGFVGAMEATYNGHGTTHNRCVDWVNSQRLDTVLVTGICTDICVMDFVLTMLSARNHGLMPSLVDIVVLEPACATYDLPLETATALGLPPTSAHPKAATHHMGLYFMASRGAVLAHSVNGLTSST